MKGTFSLLLFILLINISAEAWADEKVIRLVCSCSYTIDENGVKSVTTGEDLITVKYSQDGKAIIRKQGLGAEFYGKITDEEIVGETNYKIQGTTYHQELNINRYTGEFYITFGVLRNDGLVHYGKCSPASEKKF